MIGVLISSLFCNMPASFQLIGHGLPSWPEMIHFIRVQLFRFYGTELLRLKWWSLVIFLVLCTHPLVLRSEWLTRMRLRLHAYAQDRKRAVWTCILLPMVLRVVLLPAVPLNPPSVHDEFSALLLADTLRSGRLTNPPHPFWQHFETVHVIQQPTYNSMYQPGVGAFLALGQLLGNPWIGVLISVGLMCGAICWMLQAWMPPAWAFGGGIVAAIQIGFGSYWMNSYIASAPVPAMAGALLFGAVPRFLRKPTRMLPVVFATGIVLLVNTRPLEGTVLTIFAFGLALARYRAASERIRSAIRVRTLMPGMLVLAAGAAFTLYYAWRVTHNPFQMPYVVHRNTYGWPENLAFLPPLKLTYRHQILADMGASELANRVPYTTLGRMLNNWGARAALIWGFYAGPSLTLPLLALPWVLRRRKSRFLFWTVIFLAALNTLQLVAYPQHVSPLTAIFYFLLLSGMRQIYVWARSRSLMPERLMTAIAVSLVCGAVLTLCMKEFGIRPGTWWEWPHWQFYEARADIIRKLDKLPGKHLVFVRYDAGHSPHEEWVYNAANINRSRIVWANMMGLKEDTALRQYFADRQAWIVAPDEDPSGFLPFTTKTYKPETALSCMFVGARR